MNTPRIFSLLLLLLVVLTISIPVSAQIPPPPAPEDVPLDPLSWTLLGAGGVAAAKKYRDHKRKQNEQ